MFVFNLIPKKNCRDTIQPIVGGNKGVHAFSKGISSKVNVITWLEFELVYFEAAVQYFSPYATWTPENFIKDNRRNNFNLVMPLILSEQTKGPN